MSALPALRESVAPLVRLGSAEVACEVRLTALDRRSGEARYAIELSNGTPEPIGCRLMGIDAGRARHELGAVAIGAAADAALVVSVPLRARRWRRLEVEVIGQYVHLAAAAALPALPKRSRALRAGLLLLALGGTASACGGAFLLRAPVAAAPAALPAPVVVRVAAAPAPRIASFAARRDAYDGRASVLASYAAEARSGTVSVRDAQGRLLGQAPFSHVGTTRVALAKPAAGRITASLEVRRDALRAVSTVELGPAAPAPVREPPAPPAAALPAGGPLGVLGTPVGGRPFAVALRAGLRFSRVALEDERGEELDAVVPAGAAATVTLRAPLAPAGTRLLVAATYAKDGGDEVAVRAFRLAAP